MTLQKPRPMRDALSVALLRSTLAILFIAIFRFVATPEDDPAMATLTAIHYAVGMITALLIYIPGRTTTSAAFVGWCAVLTFATVAMLLLDPETRSVADRVPQLAVVMFLLGTTLTIIAHYLPAPIVVSLFALAAALPIWAGPLVEYSGNTEWLTRLVVSISPLTAFAVVLDLDYLRTIWFYENSAIGALRYEYPAYSSIVVSLAVVPAIAFLRRCVQSLASYRYPYLNEVHP